MAALRFSDDIALGPEDFPLRSVRVELELGLAADGVPREAHHRLVVEALRRLLEEAREGRVLAKPVRPTRAPPQDAKLHKKSARSVHRFLLAVEDLTSDGPAPTLSEVGRRAGRSGPPMAKIVNPATKVGAYAAPLIKVQKDGHAKRITLTAQGRRAVERIASGELES